MAQWQSSFERDTLTLHFARLARVLLAQVLVDGQLMRHYKQWLAAVPEDADDDLIPTFVVVELCFEALGRFVLKARPRPNEVLLIAQHDQFCAAVGMSKVLPSDAHSSFVLEDGLDAVCVAHFDGDASLATRWAIDLRAWIVEHPIHEAVQHSDADQIQSMSWWSKSPIEC